MLRRAVAVELETTKELNRLLYFIEEVYKRIVREVAEYAVENNVLSATQLQGIFTISIGWSIRACMLT